MSTKTQPWGAQIYAVLYNLKHQNQQEETR